MSFCETRCGPHYFFSHVIGRMKSTLDENVQTDCEAAEADADLMRLYAAVLEQQRTSDVFVVSPTISTAARVVLAGRVVDYMERTTSTVALENVTQRMASFAPYEANMMLSVLCKLMALYIRDYPEKSQAITTYYQSARMFVKSDQCVVL